MVINKKDVDQRKFSRIGITLQTVNSAHINVFYRKLKTLKNAGLRYNSLFWKLTCTSTGNGSLAPCGSGAFFQADVFKNLQILGAIFLLLKYLT
ncbi:hypothetical protein DVA43_03285 [Leclercia sp. W6]|nr:hypothetical protein DVA43_03285 [Leclercia sp. W6]